MSRGHGAIPPPPHGYGKTFLIGGTLVAAGLSAVWLSMVRSKQNQERTGTNPSYEQLLAHVAEKPGQHLSTTPLVGGSASPPPIQEHDHKKRNLDDFRSSPEYRQFGEAGRRSVPSPQRAKADGKSVYTKAPEYTKNYDKTANASIPK
ncbi:hypothetical protein BDQ12DRAFT_666312 [Crucibulum laeve]|uniref:Uncharacterized protein n=1 Tax=Crucibulum laeve TaxID=68775 RepID=A0A5C3M191_9AGAR|nr:hypothetical protein BDQ12DRAFT_666312 [Crucibulum laeve]